MQDTISFFKLDNNSKKITKNYSTPVKKETPHLISGIKPMPRNNPKQVNQTIVRKSTQGVVLNLKDEDMIDCEFEKF